MWSSEAVWTGFVFVLMIILSGCSESAPVGDRSLPNRLERAIQAGEGHSVRFDSLTSFQWGQFCVFPPYTTESIAEEALGFEWEYSWSAVENLDDRVYLVFVDRGEVIAAFEYRRERGDFAFLEQQCYTPEEAHFAVRNEGVLKNGDPHYVLRDTSVVSTVNFRV